MSKGVTGGVRSIQAIEDADGVITLFGFDAQERCIVSAPGLERGPTASLQQSVNQALVAGLPDWNTREAEAAALYDLLSSPEEGWEIIAEHDGERYTAYEEDMSRNARRLAGMGYVLGLLHLKPEGNWFEVAGMGSIWHHTFASPVEAEAALDELGQDCEIYAIADLLARDCALV